MSRSNRANYVDGIDRFVGAWIGACFGLLGGLGLFLIFNDKLSLGIAMALGVSPLAIAGAAFPRPAKQIAKSLGAFLPG